jgi:shikimate dehydrogenase
VTDLVLLLGERIGYSASPAMHNAAFAHLGMDVRYELADVDAAALADAVASLRAADRIGANVTRPHKRTVCAMVDELSPDVVRTGASNTIASRAGRLVAFNTDLPAIADELRSIGPARHAVVLGTGGASAAALATLADAGTSVTVVGRDAWASIPRVIRGADLVINATPIGTESDESPLDPDLLRPDLTVLDLVYRPSPTVLVRAARAAGATAQDGSGVLLRQAVLSFELWTGADAPIEVMADALRVELGVATHA